MTTALIVGASLAGGRAAETLRAAGYDGRIVLIGAEPERPYERPPLSKDYLAGDRPPEKLYLRPAEFYTEQSIECRFGVRATGLDPAARRVTLADGENLLYDDLIIATGATPRRLNVPGGELSGIHYLRTKSDADRLRTELAEAGRVVVVGAGFIGAEVAATARQAGREVVVLEALPVPLERALGRAVGEAYGHIHRERGVDLRTNEMVSAMRGQGRVEEVVTATGATFGCDLVVVGVGVVPEVEWLAGSGVAIDNGILVDEYCRTNLPNVYAAGDIANWWHPELGVRLRVEHDDNAQNQGAAAARSLAGQGEPYAPVPYFWSDQYEYNLQFVGHPLGGEGIVFRADPASDSWSAFYLLDGRVTATFAVSRFKDISAARRLIGQQTRVAAEQLRDESVDLRALARGAGS